MSGEMGYALFHFDNFTGEKVYHTYGDECPGLYGKKCYFATLAEAVEARTFFNELGGKYNLEYVYIKGE